MLTKPFITEKDLANAIRSFSGAFTATDTSASAIATTDDTGNTWAKKTFQNGGFYEGTWNGDKMEGYGTMEFPSKSTYKGYFKNGVQHGYGEYNWTNKEKYIGEWHEGFQVGFGVNYFPNNSKYVG